MDSLNGHSARPASRDGSEATSPESVRGDALLQDTLDEIADLFRIKEAFPYGQGEKEEDRPMPRRPSLWRRVADWCLGRAAGPGA